ncbi:hypothetical protein GLOTRDRAFT_135531 [Gloeophyllum trabeum ATCC 11539]|uniref:Uncharacterized protein n=1 Tax=Gloeophyllum trabeum (strain ATCC 11539 / FP-39264 / Madison 617) TaxID=670483 RepID=S7QN94_GLOTA|nr:uncharacterized protein GLOTRDRAFT_135531 [Gloeophyllum trabeum ATCC 11539]EPQ60942.1 hypothetical protein GLOTRDRAFT_135531 [Gloeophyllum trabeum ATCC 11539]
MFSAHTLVHLRPTGGMKPAKRPQSAPGSTDAEDQYHLPATNAPILLPADSPSRPDSAGEESSPRRARPAQKSLSYAASESNLRRDNTDSRKPPRRIRKLPPLPLAPEPTTFPTSTPQTLQMSQFPRSPRPLPSPPASSCSAQGFPPVPPPRSASLPHFRLPRAEPSALAIPVGFPKEPPSPGCFSPTTPITPAVTAEEAKTKNFSKLRRFLGESVPPDLVLRPHSRASSATSSEASDSTPDPLLVTPEEVVDSYAKRMSRKWVREKKGQRWVESDYQDVLNALRKL